MKRNIQSKLGERGLPSSVSEEIYSGNILAADMKKV